jgi:hypothetical protein
MYFIFIDIFIILHSIDPAEDSPAKPVTVFEKPPDFLPAGNSEQLVVILTTRYYLGSSFLLKSLLAGNFSCHQHIVIQAM